MRKWFFRKRVNPYLTDPHDDTWLGYKADYIRRGNDSHLFYDVNQDKVIITLKNKYLPNGELAIKIEKGTERDIALRRYLISKGCMPESAASTRVLTRKDIPRLITSIDLPDQILAQNAFPLGQGDKGKDIIWDIRVTPHLLIVGGEETGKSTIIRTILTHCYRYGNDWGIEGFDLSFIRPEADACHYRSCENYQYFPYPASSLEEAVSKMSLLHAEMTARAAEMKEYGERHYSGRRKLVYIDNAQLVLSELPITKMSEEETEARSKMSRFVADLISDGPKVGFHAVLATDRLSIASTEWIKSFPARIFLSRISTYTSNKLVGSKVLAAMTGYIKGRAWLDINGDVEEFQNYLFEPDYHERVLQEL